MAGLSARLPDGPPNEAERQHAWIHRPNSGTRPTLRETAFQRHSWATGQHPVGLFVGQGLYSSNMVATSRHADLSQLGVVSLGPRFLQFVL
jgi:hypothetical protein